MKLFPRILSIILCLSMLCSFSSCAEHPIETVPTTTEAVTEPTTLPQPSTEEIYTAAVRAVEAASHLELSVSATERVSFGTEVYTQSKTQNISIQNYGSDAVICTVEDSTTQGEYVHSSTEYYSDGVAYIVLDSIPYCSKMSAGDYLARFVPAVLIDAALYDSVSEEAATDGNTILVFEQPTGAERWAMPEYGQLLSASGSATLDGSGQLTKSTYTLSYRRGSALVTLDTTVTVTIPEDLSLNNPLPVAEDAYTELEYIDAPMLLNKAVYNLLQSNSLSCSINSTMVSQAGGTVLARQNQVATYLIESSLQAKVQQNITLAASDGSTDTYTLTETFRNGTYSASENGGEPVSQAVTAAQMADYCLSTAIENIWSAEYLGSAVITDLGSIYRLDLTGNDALRDMIYWNTCAILFDNPNVLDEVASSYEDIKLEGFLSIDKYTGLPVAFNYSFERSHVIDGEVYPLTEELALTFLIGSDNTYETVTGEPLPEEQPEVPATPLFYHVTGSDGQEMWLLGTIHVGDNRTAYLPQEIYDALDVSNALAVECDTVAFEENVSADPALLSAVSEAYFYPDNSTGESHVTDPALYSRAIDFLKAAGRHNITTEFNRITFLSQEIENFYIQQSYSLTSVQGVDARLLKLAREKNLEIREIESVAEQTWMFANFSEPLQQMLLEEAMTYTSAEYNAEMEALYELWCAGDEAALREYLNEEPIGLTDDEQTLYKEYDYAVLTSRNEKMLETAFDYLLSGETVFYAVGLAHLLQGNGLVDALRSAGYTVELVTYS